MVGEKRWREICPALWLMQAHNARYLIERREKEAEHRYVLKAGPECVSAHRSLQMAKRKAREIIATVERAARAMVASPNRHRLHWRRRDRGWSLDLYGTHFSIEESRSEKKGTRFTLAVNGKRYREHRSPEEAKAKALEFIKKIATDAQEIAAKSRRNRAGVTQKCC